MNWNSIVFKLGGTIFIILMSVILPLTFTIDRLFSSFYLSEAHHQVDQLALQYSNTLSDLEDIDSLQTVANLTKTEICIIDQDGRILFTSNDKLFRQGTQFGKELLTIIHSNKAVKIDYRNQMEYLNPINNVNYLVSGKPLHLSTQVDGGLVVFSDKNQIKKSIHHIELLLLASMLGALCMALGFIYIASKKLASPLLQMEKATRDIAKGKFYRKVTISSNDEVGSLALAINDLGQELERYRNRQKEFFANISHDLRTPISYIKGYTEVIHNKLYKDEREKDLYLSIILDEANQLNVLITDLFELSKIEGGQLDLHFNWINIHELVENCLTKADLKAKQKEIQLHKEIDDNIPFIYTDGVRVEQILMNLLENAIRYNRLGGHVKVRGWVDKKKVHLLIEDTGIGISKEDLPYIFERFYKADKSRSKRIGSTGLGLSIVKHLVLLLEGDIKVKSKLHKGTTFYITLPFSITGDIKDEGA
ncbi:MAG TPA: HAMP domain-containing sensor histidine kinase [Bacillus sp. (in: firmicutes)]|nr:HAMP domain-containing sensor histidine kinase [Bacillus sp. (in: firmicutes)]